jgi:hypothetical protein
MLQLLRTQTENEVLIGHTDSFNSNLCPNLLHLIVYVTKIHLDVALFPLSQPLRCGLD